MRHRLQNITRNVQTIYHRRAVAASATKPSIRSLSSLVAPIKSRLTLQQTHNRGIKVTVPTLRRAYANPPPQEVTSSLSTAEYNAFSDETMEALLSALELLVDEAADVSYEVEYSSGVLTLKVGKNGTYVINKQPPNKQIWLSSPLSGPKRYDYNPDSGKWIYTRDGVSLGQLLEQELSGVFDKRVQLGIEPSEKS